jgi:hypothetical protein
MSEEKVKKINKFEERYQVENMLLLIMLFRKNLIRKHSKQDQSMNPIVDARILYAVSSS